MRYQLRGISLVLLAVLFLALGGCARGAYVGSSMSHRYHVPDCLWAEELDRERQVWFATVAEAEAADYEPCSTCLPDGPPAE